MRKAILTVACESLPQSLAGKQYDVFNIRVWYIRGCRTRPGHGGRLTWHTSTVLD